MQDSLPIFRDMSSLIKGNKVVARLKKCVPKNILRLRVLAGSSIFLGDGVRTHHTIPHSSFFRHFSITIRNFRLQRKEQSLS